MKRIGVLIALLLILGSVNAEERAPSCPQYDLTGRVLVETNAYQGYVTCEYKRPATAEECPNNSPQGWTIVGVVNPGNKDKITCLYAPVSGG